MEIEDFSMEQLAGQRIMAGFTGTTLDGELKALISDIKVGGIILFAQNIKNPLQIKDLCLSAGKFALDCGQPPLLIAIDQEGGVVARLKEPFTVFPGPPEMKDEKDAVNFAQITAKEMKSVGINMNMAPVMDVVPNGFTSIMDKRVFGNDPELVAKMGSAIIKNLQANGIMAVAKHFPGIGRTTLDSHLDRPFLDIGLIAMESTDLVPFYQAIYHKVSGIMLSHIYYTSLDPDLPASLSKKIAKDLLRDHMGFNGVVMTDDLDMGAVKKYHKIKDAVKKIMEAEIDLALICHKGPGIKAAFDAILDWMKSSSRNTASAEESVTRIIKLKESFLK